MSKAFPVLLVWEWYVKDVMGVGGNEKMSPLHFHCVFIIHCLYVCFGAPVDIENSAFEEVWCDSNKSLVLLWFPKGSGAAQGHNLSFKKTASKPPKNIDQTNIIWDIT